MVYRIALLLTMGLALRATDPVVQLHVLVPMRDGVKLSANIFRPAGTGRFPVLVHRTPYKKVPELTPGLRAFVDRGYAVVSQDVRGRYESEGEYRQFLQESQDGEDTLSWVARQPWSDGKIGMFGGSYVGLAQWRTALTGHPALRAIAPAVAGGDEYFDRFYSKGGAFKLGHRLRWISENFKPNGTPVVDFLKLVTYLPLRRADRFATGQSVDFFQLAMDHPSYDDYWKGLSTIARIDRVKVPALIQTGWYDNYGESDLEMWNAMRAQGRASRIIVGPWGHNLSAAMPDADFGKDAMPSLRRMEIEWFDAYVKGVAPPPAPVARYFVMGTNEWKESESWPPPGMTPTPLFLTSKKGANSLNGDGKLTNKAPKKSGADTYIYDPANAVPTVGGALCCNVRVFPWGPINQQRVEGRRDVLVYTGDPLKKPVEIAGPVRVALYVRSSAPDTDFTAKLVDVYPNGRAKILCDGILRLRARQGADHVSRYTPGTVERIEIPAGTTSNVFLTGHRIRLDISSSNFPKYDRNLNTGRVLADEKEWRSARQEVLFGKETASMLVLPVVK
jgi:putative CocE/NonD family hydrolase